jgi:hypothetical protein
MDPRIAMDMEHMLQELLPDEALEWPNQQLLLQCVFLTVRDPDIHPPSLLELTGRSQVIQVEQV